MEHLIRTRGLKKPKMSRRVRLLHNIYAWMRIVSESTHVIERSCERRQVLSTASVEECQEDATLDNFLQLEPWYENAQDIHLATSNDDAENMYMEIYGVPETWLRLVSQITRLANIMDRLRPRQNRMDAEYLAALQPNISQLEDAVGAFHDRYRIVPQPSPHDHMVQALSSALVIFFHRRVRDGPSHLLQNSVNKVLKSLHAFDASLSENRILCPGTAWPAFIAGSEADSEDQKQQFAAWLEKAFKNSGWRGYEISLEIMREVWRARSSIVGGSTWVQVCRRTSRWPLLC